MKGRGSPLPSRERGNWIGSMSILGNIFSIEDGFLLKYDK